MRQNLTSKILELLVRVVSFDYFFVKKILREFVNDYKPKVVLDLGCGTGILAPFFLKSGYFGVDIEEDLINYASKQHPGYTFRAIDATKVKLGIFFDCIVVVGVIHHLNDQDAKKFVNTMAIHLKKSGRVLVIEAIPPIVKWNIFAIINRKMDRGAFIRDTDYYRKLVRSKFNIEKSYDQLGGAADYGVLILSHKSANQGIV